MRTFTKTLHLFLGALLLLSSINAIAQTNLRAWYAKGQVWIIWQSATPFPETYGIYKSATSFTSTTQATPIGRPYFYEYLPGTFIEQTKNTQFTYTIPTPDGGTYKLAAGEALFVETTTSAGAAYYGVVAWGKTSFVAGVNVVNAAVKYQYDPVKDPVECHLQFSNTLNGGYPAKWYGLWLMGRADHNVGRPDFPVLANAFKNGMPAMFIVSEAINMDTSKGKLIPATNWLHGGGGTAIQITADKNPQFNIAPQVGITIAHTDDLVHKTIFEGDTSITSGRSAWFGWPKSFNPFDPGYDAGPGDTIINYTQRRVFWINKWVQQKYHVDPQRVAIQGYSMGSGGAGALGKAFPELFSTISTFNNGFRRVNEETIIKIQGSVEENLPTNLFYPNGKAVGINQIFDLQTRISKSRDLPIFRAWSGKNDINSRMHWGADLIAQYRIADSLGYGVQINWDERPHTYETLGYHWINDVGVANQTVLDNVATQELFTNRQSYPGFFNHRLEQKNNDPGSGKTGINNGDGDNWGTWGGYHRWDLKKVVDQNELWSVEAWLENTATFGNDNCPVDALVADLAIRKPQVFAKNKTPKALRWKVEDVATGAILQQGNTSPRVDSLVVVPKVTLYRQNIRKVKISVFDPLVATRENLLLQSQNLRVEPNPSGNTAFLSIVAWKNTSVWVRAVGIDGRITSFKTQLLEGKNRISLAAFENLPRGYYFLELVAEQESLSTKWVKME